MQILCRVTVSDQRLRLRLQAARERVARNRRLEDEAGKDGEAGT
jgi:hypothetical protein